MATLIGAMFDALGDAEQESYSTEQEETHPAEELIDAVADFLNASKREQIAEVLRDENGLRPTDAALDVLLVVAEALDALNEHWDDQTHVPAGRDYALAVETALDEQYGVLA